MHSISIVWVALFSVIISFLVDFKEFTWIAAGFACWFYESAAWLIRGLIRLVVLWPLGFYQRGDCRRG